MFFLPTKDCKEYRLEGCLVGHKNVINCLTVSSNGSLLASSGSDGMRIWDLKQRLQLPSPRQNIGLQNPANPVMCACWITCLDATRETLCYGTGLGFIGIWQQQGEGMEDFDAKVSRRIAQDKHIQVWSFNFKGPLLPIFSIELSTMILRTINFSHSASQNLLVFGMYDGEVHALWGTDGVIIAMNNAGPLIGHASVDNAQTLFLIDNVMNGFSLHHLDDAVCIRTYNTNPVKTFPKQVVFGEKTDMVVGGSDAGVIYVFDKNEGTLRQVLKHADKARSRRLTDYETHDGTYHSIIVGATSQNDAEPVISIWSHQRNNLEMPHPLGRAFKNFVWGVVQLAIAMALLTYCVTMNTSISFESLGSIWQNLARPQDLTNEDIRVWVEQYIEHQGEMNYRTMSKRVASNDDAPTAKCIRIDEDSQSQTAPLADERTWRILEEFLTTDMTYPQMEEALLSYLGNQYSEDEWKESRDALFSSDSDDKIALENLRVVKAKHIPLASCVPKDHSVTDRRLSQAHHLQSKNPYLDLYAGEDDGEEDKEDEDEGEDDNDSDVIDDDAWKVTCLPGSSSATRFAAVIDDLADKFEDTQHNSSQDRQPLPSSISGLIALASARSQDGRMYLLHVCRNAIDYVAQHLRKKNFRVTMSAWLAGQLYVVADSPKTISQSLPFSLYLVVKEYVVISDEEREVVEQSCKKLPNPAWVRFKHDKYKGDITQVFDSDLLNNFVAVLVPPRELLYPMPQGSRSLLD
ncbi:WD40-repeat-containing domain protein [Suillus subalutaceus]|uniref:WD40-repeat-containing domain protein n=1 Tax=Suillus subalutaceus TaxID=48586 RepID=UPI001B865182|nr:WD40-repeat-containing domain protein [Suillus subalutaceus]KAG1846393.1 WD40-repeat-containing domain protein [Suillus subalutaceus]